MPTCTPDAAIPASVKLPGEEAFEILVDLLKAERVLSAECEETSGLELVSDAIVNLFTAAFREDMFLGCAENALYALALEEARPNR